MARTTRAAARRRARTAVGVSLVLLAGAGCGLQRTGVDGVVAAQQAGTAAGTAGAGPAGSANVGGSLGSGGAGGAVPGPTGTSMTTGGTTTGGTAGTSGIVGGTGVTGPTTSGSTSQSGAAAQTPGLKGELTVAYVNVTGFDQLGKVVVVNTASTGDARAQTAALASYVNSHGGIAGRKLVPKVHDYNAQQASEVNDNNLCQTITQTDKAFLAVLHGQIHYSARDCYAAKKTLAFEGAAYGFGHAFYEAHQPYLWSPSYADYDAAERALVKSVRERKWLAGETKVGVVLWDDKPYHDIADKTLVPLLKAAGMTVVQAAVSNADIGSIENGIHAAAQTMVTQQVDHVMFIGSAPLQPFFVQQNQQDRQFVYAMTSYDVPRYMAVNFPNSMAGAIGVGFSPVDDVLDPQYAFPQPGLETECKAIYKKYGIDLPARYEDKVFNAKQALSYCESTLLLKHVADSMTGDLTPAAWTAAAQQLGSRFQVAQTFVTSYSSNKHTGATVFRDITYDAGCTCMTYTSGNRPLS